MPERDERDSLSLKPGYFLLILWGNEKYDKYDLEKQRDLNPYGDDAFARLYATVKYKI